MAMDLDLAAKLLASGVSAEEIRQELADYFMGLYAGIDLSNNSPNLFLLDALALGSYGLNSKFLEVKNNLDPETAEGTALRKIGFIAAGILPINASKTVVKTYIDGERGAMLPKGFVIKNSANRRFFLKSDVYVTNENVYEVELKERADFSGECKLILRFGDLEESFESSLPNFADNLNYLVTKINFNPNLSAVCVANIVGSRLIITANHHNMSVFLVKGLEYEKIKVRGDFEAEETGAVEFGAGEAFYAAVQGIEKIRVIQVVVGTEEETDAEFRGRMGEALENLGAAQNRLVYNIKKENPSITYIRVFENDTKEVSEEGLPPNSIECIVEGGDEYTLAKSIWNWKGGVSTYSSMSGAGDYGVSVIIQDDWGKSHRVNYTRPRGVGVSLTVYLSSEKGLDAFEAERAVQLLVMQFVAKYNKIGEDFSLGRLSAYITENFPKVENTETEAQTPKGAGQFTNWAKNTNIKVKYTEVLVFEPARIEVVIK